MQAAGNDFVLIDARDREEDWPALAKAMCDRHFGVGADGILLLLPSTKADFHMRIFNPDGSEAEACGNGIRCFAKYVVEKGLKENHQSQLAVETLTGVRELQTYMEKGRVVGVRAGMGVPRFKPAEIPVSVEGKGESPIMDYPVTVKGREIEINCLSMGNPHAVAFLNSQPRVKAPYTHTFGATTPEERVEDYPLSQIGPQMEHHPIFPQRVNFEIAQVLDRNHIEARVWERGAGETLACGSGACAIAVAARLHDLADSPVEITLPGGTLTLEWDGEGEVYLTGSAQFVFEGEWGIEPFQI